MLQKRNQNVADFIVQLNTKRSQMDEERVVMSDTDFGKLYNVSCTAVTNYMGKMEKNIRYKSTIKHVSMSEINGLRKIHKDSYIARKYNSSLATINRYFGSRESLGLKKYKEVGVIDKNSVANIRKRLEENKTPVGEFCWWYPVEKPYWEIDKKVELCIGAHPSLFLKIV